MAQDRHDYFKGLMASGISEQQAEAIAKGYQTGDSENVATKEDILLLKRELQAEMAQLETKLTNRLGAFISLAVAVQSVIIAALQLWT